MSMLIIGVNPPKSCYVCSWYNKVQCPVNDGRYYYRTERHPSCPLVEIPTPHGRLVDFDKMVDEYWDGSSMRIGKTDIKDIEEYDTVIEAGGSEERSTTLYPLCSASGWARAVALFLRGCSEV